MLKTSEGIVSSNRMMVQASLLGRDSSGWEFARRWKRRAILRCPLREWTHVCRHKLLHAVLRVPGALQAADVDHLSDVVCVVSADVGQGGGVLGEGLLIR